MMKEFLQIDRDEERAFMLGLRAKTLLAVHMSAKAGGVCSCESAALD